MKQEKMQRVLDDLNRKWGLDFVSATAGVCCSACSEFETPEEDNAYENADTILILNWFSDGMNYTVPFEQRDLINVRYDFRPHGTLTNIVSIPEVCRDLQIKLAGFYDVIEPPNTTKTIKLVRIK